MKPLLALLLGLTVWMLWRYVRQASTPDSGVFYVPEFEQDPETGEWTAYNDLVRVMAIGDTPAQAAERFRQAHHALIEWQRKRPGVRVA